MRHKSLRWEPRQRFLLRMERSLSRLASRQSGRACSWCMTALRRPQKSQDRKRCKMLRHPLRTCRSGIQSMSQRPQPRRSRPSRSSTRKIPRPSDFQPRSRSKQSALAWERRCRPRNRRTTSRRCSIRTFQQRMPCTSAMRQSRSMFLRSRLSSSCPQRPRMLTLDSYQPHKCCMRDRGRQKDRSCRHSLCTATQRGRRTLRKTRRKRRRRCSLSACTRTLGIVRRYRCCTQRSYRRSNT
jgi:hypothetical protein